MAENKKSVLVYADWLDKFEELEDDEAGRLKNTLGTLMTLNRVPRPYYKLSLSI
jgi:hypothetical protein